ncbi:hypothetical protein C6P45_001114 [Maudiozyma exigua]|uniref:Uncharacterized protein n=1 Tax=Maudiozyma exigua TaxID=34358 RepID=A0A9P7B7C2_MAUEX|nr:hypothetical protein C6P45_001114 [Kazachstania exigua]
MSADLTDDRIEELVNLFHVSLLNFNNNLSNNDKINNLTAIIELLRLMTNDKRFHIHLQNKNSNNIDIFEIIWSIDDDTIINYNLKLFYTLILFAFNSIFNYLTLFQYENINNWLHYIKINDMTSLSNDKQLSYFDFINFIDSFDIMITPNTLNYILLKDNNKTNSINYYSNLLKSNWIPTYLQQKKSQQQLQINDLSKILTNPIKLDLTIINDTKLLQLIQLNNSYINKFLSIKMLQNYKWFNNTSKKFIINAVFSDKNYNINDINFNIQVMMEILDHSNLNLLKEDKLCFLLFISLNNLKFIDLSIIHKELTNMGSTQTFAALLNMIQFIISRTLLSKQYNTILPDWFENSIIPQIPPISKSLFTFQDQKEKIVGSYNVTDNNITLLYWSLLNIMTINNKILTTYSKWNLNPLKIATKNNDSLKHLLSNNYMNLYNITTMTTLILSQSIIQNSLSTMKQLNFGKSLFMKSIKIFENLINLHGNIALFHIIKFANKISLQNLSLQKNCIILLNHLFFHNIDDSNMIMDHYNQNKLSQVALKEYIMRWNDGSEIYSKFFKQLLKSSQPSVINKTITIQDLFKYLPKEQQDEYTNLSSNNNNNNNIIRTIEPQPQKNIKSYINTNKFNAYNSTTFVPSTTNSITNNYLFATPPNTIQHQMANNTNIYNNSFNGMNSIHEDNNELGIHHSTDTFSAFNSPFTLPSNKTTEMLNSTPKTPNSTSTNNIQSPWNQSSAVTPNHTMSGSKIVNTGKNYILGGHNRVKNNSRAQSIHIDQFQDDI